LPILVSLIELKDLTDVWGGEGKHLRILLLELLDVRLSYLLKVVVFLVFIMELRFMLWAIWKIADLSCFHGGFNAFHLFGFLVGGIGKIDNLAHSIGANPLSMLYWIVGFGAFSINTLSLDYFTELLAFLRLMIYVN
jgi:hypothetical protein